jgi:hypothetical protein
MSELDNIRRLIDNHNQRLQILKEQQALTGLKTDPSTIIEIRKIEEELERLYDHLKAAEEAQSRVSPLAEANQAKKSSIPKLFYSYAHEDEEIRDRLATHLKLLQRQKKLDVWYDREIGAGAEWEAEIKMHLSTADIILLLISPAFMASDFCYDIEMVHAIERHDAGEAIVVPVILRPTDWSGAPFSKLQALPKNAKPVTLWQNEDEALLDIAQGLRNVAERLIAKASS